MATKADSPKIICRVKALYAFTSTEKSSLSFGKDEYIDVLSQLDSGWWDGWCKGNRGWFPSNYVEVVEANPRMPESDDDSEEEARTIRLLKSMNNPTEIESVSRKQHSLESLPSYCRPKEIDDEQPALPNGWELQIADDGITKFYYNKKTGGLRYNHPGILDSDDEIDDDTSGDDDDLPVSFNFDDFGSVKTRNSTMSFAQESINLMSCWSKRTTPQGKVYYANTLTNETTWNYEDIDPTTGRLKSNKDDTNDEADEECEIMSSREFDMLVNENEPMTWKSVATHIAQSVQDLQGATTRGEHVNVYKEKIAVVVNAVRYMLYASRSMDKDAPHLQQIDIKESLRVVLSTLAKLILSAKAVNDTNTNINVKIQRDANDVLHAVRRFISICQDKDLPMESIFPKFITGDDNDLKQQTVLSTPRFKYPLNQDLIVNLQTHVKQIGGSTDALCKASLYIQTLEQKQKEQNESEEQYMILDQRARSNVVILFQNISSQVGNFLTILSDIDMNNTESLQLQNVQELRCNKQKLYNAVGLLFNAVQTITDTQHDLSISVETVNINAKQMEELIETIFANVTQMVGDRKAWLMKNGGNEPWTYEIKKDESPEDPALRLSKGQQRSSISANKPLQREYSFSHGPDEKTQFWFLGYDYAEGDIEFTQDKSIKGGTLRALVERLTLHDFIDMSYIANFLLTYRSFCTTEEFVSLLQDRYNLAPPEGLTPEELEIWTDKKQKLVRLRVFNVMKNWLENYYNDEDEFILDDLQFFANTVIYDSSTFSAEQLNRLIRKRRELNDNGGGLKKLIPNTTYGPMPILPKNMQQIRLLEIDPLEIARQLTIMDFKLYSSIRPIECLGKAWSQEGAENAINVKQSIDYCNRLTSWVTGSILSHREAKKRVVAIKYWSQVANRCLEMNNYNTCMAILSAFDNSAIGRLKKTWELVSNRTSQSLAYIRKLMGSNRNFTEYREMIHSVNPPCIPFLGIYLQDLTFIEDGNPDFLKTSSYLINFAKQQKSAEVIREIKQFQSPPYIYQFVPEIQEFIKHQLDTSRDIDFLYERSLELEPRIAVNNDNAG